MNTTELRNLGGVWNGHASPGASGFGGEYRGGFNGNANGSSYWPEQIDSSELSSSSKKLIFFVGDNLVGNLAANKILPRVIRQGYEPVLYVTSGSRSPKAQQPHIKYLNFYGAGLLDEVITPYMKDNPLILGDSKPIKGVSYSYDQIRDFGIQVHKIKDVNDPEIVERIERSQRLSGSYSLKNYGIFKNPIIRAHDKNGAHFVNIHTGLIPRWQGVFIPLHSALAGETEQGWTAHKIVYLPDHPQKGIDMGPIIDTRVGDFNYENTSIVEEELLFALGPGADFVVNTIAKLHDFSIPPLTPQDPNSARYFSFPLREQFDEALNSNRYKIARSSGIAALLADHYAPAAYEHQHNGLKEALTEAIGRFEYSRWPAMKNAAPASRVSPQEGSRVANDQVTYEPQFL